MNSIIQDKARRIYREVTARTGVCLTVLLLGCNGIGCAENSDQAPPAITEISHHFAADAEGWVGGFADYPQGQENAYELIFNFAHLPAPLDDTQGSLMISGNNHSDDLFMFVKRKITGLTPGRTYELTFNIEFASNVADGLVGVGGSPGEGVTIKAGATQVEPVPVLDPQDKYYRMNIDIGNQTQGGSDMIAIGDFSNDTDRSVYTLKAVTNPEPFLVQTSDEGELWLVMGSDSGFEATTTIYYHKISVLLN